LRPALKNTFIIIFYIHKESYNFNELLQDFYKLFSNTICPACQEAGFLKKHANYEKYYYTVLIPILRCKCTFCETTHAIIPSFSLPGTSVGTKEVEEYLEFREKGIGRGRAGKKLFERGMSKTNCYYLDKTFKRAVARAKTLFEDSGDSRKIGISWIQEVTGKKEHPILSLNQFCLDEGANVVCFSRVTIIIFRKKNANKRFSHNALSCAEKGGVVDS
jgi:hypothetical protein